MLSRGRDSQGEEVMRSYTPITLDSDIGYFELVVKVQNFCGQILAKE
jgi:cytochrome-b5 reductase